MTNILFAFRRPAKDPQNPEKTVLQDNYINPFQVISAFWDETRADGKKVLNVFTLTYTYTLPEKTGLAFIAHWENALRALVTSGLANITAAAPENQPRQRKPRPIMDATEVADMDLSEATEWSQPQN